MTENHILQQLVQLRHLLTERDTILQTNKYYQSQIIQLELKTSELVVQLRQKTKQIQQLTDRSSFCQSEGRASTQPSQKTHDIQHQIHLLQIQNQQLKPLLATNQRLQSLKHELNFTQDLKRSYKNKYQALQGRKPEQQGSLQQEVKQLQSQYQKKVQEANQAIRERDYLKKDVIPFLQKNLYMYQAQKVQMQNQIEKLKEANQKMTNELSRSIIEDQQEQTEKTPETLQRSSSKILEKKPSLNEQRPSSAFSQITTPVAMRVRELTSKKQGKRGKKNIK